MPGAIRHSVWHARLPESAFWIGAAPFSGSWIHKAALRSSFFANRSFSIDIRPGRNIDRFKKFARLAKKMFSGALLAFQPSPMHRETLLAFQPSPMRRQTLLTKPETVPRFSSVISLPTASPPIKNDLRRGRFMNQLKFGAVFARIRGNIRGQCHRTLEATPPKRTPCASMLRAGR